jgi:hypothetical protein
VNNVGGPGNSTVIDAVDPEREGYLYPRVAGTAYGPTSNDWRHSCLSNSAGQSASDRMPNGNIFVALSDAYMYEVDEQGTVVWQYNASPQKAFRYTCDDPGIIALLGENPCGLTTGIAGNGSRGAVQLYPNPASGIVTLGGPSTNEVESIVLFDATGREVMRAGQSVQLDVSAFAPGVHIVRVRLLSGEQLVERLVIEH